MSIQVNLWTVLALFWRIFLSRIQVYNTGIYFSEISGGRL